MSEDDSDLGVGLADLATNILAVVIIAFVLLANLPRSTPTQQESFRSITDGIVTHRTLAPADMVALLGARRQASGEAVVEALQSGIRIKRADGAVMALKPEGFAGITGDIRLIVFSNAHYRPLATALASASIREISVPAALRNPAGDDWSDGFFALTQSAADERSFRNGLALLLEGGPEPARVAGGGNGSGEAGTGTKTPLLDRLMPGNILSWLRWLFLLAMPVLALYAVIRIERRSFQSR